MGIKTKVRRAFESIKEMLKLYPVELAVALYAVVIALLLVYDVEVVNEEYNLNLIPLFLALSYLLNHLFPRRLCEKNEERRLDRLSQKGEQLDEIGRGEKVLLGKKGRLIYYLSWLLIIPTFFTLLKPWVESPKYAVAVGIALVFILIARRVKDNKLFAADSFRYFLNGAISVLFSGIAYLLVLGIYYSFIFIFGLSESQPHYFMSVSAILVFLLGTPLLFLGFIESNVGRRFEPNKFLDILANFIVSPALLIYGVVLLVYFLKILLTWSLPLGGVVVMVIAYVLIGYAMKAIQPLLSKRYYDWYYDNFSYTALPILAMFWVAIIYRVVEYSFTPSRIYIILAGVVMTVALLDFIRQDKGRYISLACFAAMLFALFTYIPPISAEQISINSQYKLAVKLANSFDMLDGDGKLKPVEEYDFYESNGRDDIERLSQLDEIIYFLNRHDSSNKEKFGMGKEWSISGRYNISMYTYSSEVLRCRLERKELSSINIENYSKLHFIEQFYSNSNFIYRLEDEKKKLSFYKITDNCEGDNEDSWELIYSVNSEDFVKELLARVGHTADELKEVDLISDISPELMMFEVADYTIVLDSISVTVGEYSIRIDYVNFSYLLER